MTGVQTCALPIYKNAPSSVILGRAILATAGADINVKEGTISFSVGREKEYFHHQRFFDLSFNKFPKVVQDFLQMHARTEKGKAVAQSETARLRQANQKDLKDLLFGKQVSAHDSSARRSEGMPPDQHPS